MWQGSWVSLDTETTGFTKDARILEIGLVYFENGQPADRWSTMLNPPDLDWYHPNVKEALAVNHITKDMCLDAPCFEDVVEELFARLSEGVWVAHNTEFDIRMLKQECERAKIKFEPEPSLQLCTMQLSHKIHPTEKSHKLGDVAPRWHVTQLGAHRAVVDAETCGLVLQKMIEGKHLPIDQVEMVSFSKEASAAWTRRRARR